MQLHLVIKNRRSNCLDLFFFNTIIDKSAIIEHSTYGDVIGKWFDKLGTAASFMLKFDY